MAESLTPWTLGVRARAVAEGVVNVTVTGEIDLANVAQLRNALSPLVADTSVRLVGCDLSGVSFVSCSGLTVLLDARQALLERGAMLRLVAASPAVLRPIRMTGLAQLLPAPTMVSPL